MQQNLESELNILRKRTGIRNDDPFLILELNSAVDWAFNAVLVMNEDILKNEDEQFTISTQTSSFDIGAAVSAADMYSIKWLGIKLPGDQKFNPVQFMDSAVDTFMSADQDTPATAHPIFCDTKNWTQVRFAPPLPPGAQILVSYIYIPRLMSLDTNAALTSSTYPGIPNAFNQCIVDKATAQLYMDIDDTRVQYWEDQAKQKLRRALNVLDKRQWQQIPRLRGFHRRSARRFF